jgi:hypothetical protein
MIIGAAAVDVQFSATAEDQQAGAGDEREEEGAKGGFHTRKIEGSGGTECAGY